MCNTKLICYQQINWARNCIWTRTTNMIKTAFDINFAYDCEDQRFDTYVTLYWSKTRFMKSVIKCCQQSAGTKYYGVYLCVKSVIPIVCIKMNTEQYNVHFLWPKKCHFTKCCDRLHTISIRWCDRVYFMNSLCTSLATSKGNKMQCSVKHNNDIHSII